MSLAASNAEELSGSVTDPAPSRLPAPSTAKTGMDAELFRVLLKAVEAGFGVVSTRGALSQPSDEWFLPGRRQPLSNDPRRSSLKFTTSS